MPGYLVISRDMDAPSISWYDTKESLVQHALQDLDDISVITKARDIPDILSWPLNTMMIIKGEIVVPKPKTTVTSYEID